MFTAHTTPEEVKNAIITGAGKSHDYIITRSSIVFKVNVVI